MKRLVTIHSVADRHADLHRRQFAVTRQVEVPNGEPVCIFNAAVEAAEIDLNGKFIVTVEEPHE